MWEGVVAGYGVAVPVGAIGVLIIGLSARQSPRVGAGAALGAATADALYAVLAVLGGAALAALIAPVAGATRWVAAAVLAAIGLRTGWVAWRDRVVAARVAVTRGGLTTFGRAYLGVLALTLLNPATVVYFAALVLGRRAEQDISGAAAATFVGGAAAASASWQLLLAGGGVLVGRALSGPRGRLATGLISAIVIVVLAVRLVR
ncbi:hypothetical protein GCM10010123_08750 [Pilimelia anulata]|uniref:Arginine exporter protein ArgO n=1 Tax=Pilimelia anulata TaxID=53371 RepID=A0A8J3F8U0_9ACTN|nr:hypothetical protein GCM10010123_08750 [Pilimelia anulata]